jgi:hypothetical protein
MWPIVAVWVAVVVVGGLLWHRFTKPPMSPTIPVPQVPGEKELPSRRVVPLWLVLVLLILLVGALWFTLQWGSSNAAAA